MEEIYVVTIIAPEEDYVGSVEVFRRKADALLFVLKRMSRELDGYGADFAYRTLSNPGRQIFEDPSVTEETSTNETYAYWNENGGFIYDDRHGNLNIAITKCNLK